MNQLLSGTILIGSLAISPASQLGSAPYIPTKQDLEEDAIYSCAYRLLEVAGKKGEGTRTLPALYIKASRDKTQEFMEWSLAVMFVESRFNKMAVSPMDARGLMQMTEIAVLEASRSCGLPAIQNQNRMHDSYTNVKYGTCYLQLMLDVTQGNWKEALILYNGGYRQLSRYRQGLQMAQETSEYVDRVNEARNICRGEEQYAH